MKRLLLKSVELQAKDKGLLIEKVSGGYIVDKTKFKTLQAVVDYIEAVQIPTNDEVTAVIEERQGKGINFKLFRQALEFFTTHPECHDQSSFSSKNSFCVAGFIVETVLPGYYRRDKMLTGSCDLARKITGLTINQAYYLFFALNMESAAIEVLTDIVALEGQPASVTLPAINESLYKHKLATKNILLTCFLSDLDRY
jgi:hypothetical protein